MQTLRGKLKPQNQNKINQALFQTTSMFDMVEDKNNVVF